MNLAQLNADCLIAILAHVPLSHLLGHVQFVCTTWAWSIVPAVCRAKRRLTLRVPGLFIYVLGDYHSRAELDQVPSTVLGIDLRKLDLPCAVSALLDRFPNVTRLEFIQYELEGWIEVACLLMARWNALTHLKVYVESFNDANCSTAAWTRLIGSLSHERMPSLRELALHDSKARHASRVPLPDTPQLESFHTGLLFDCGTWTAIRVLSSWKSLKRFGFTIMAMFDLELFEYPETIEPFFLLIPALGLTHFTYSYPLEFCEPETLLWRNPDPLSHGGSYDTLQHFVTCTARSMDELLARSGLDRLPALKHLCVVNFREITLDPLPGEDEATWPFEVQPRTTPLVYRSLQHLSLMTVPHIPLVTSEENGFSLSDHFPVLRTVKLTRATFANNHKACEVCKDPQLCRRNEEAMLEAVLGLASIRVLLYNGGKFVPGGPPPLVQS